MSLKTVNTGFKTCPNCVTYQNCPSNRALKNYLRVFILPPEIKIEKIITTASFLAESCPLYFTLRDAEK